MKNREGQKYRIINGLKGYGIDSGDECIMWNDDGSDICLFYNEKWVNNGKWYISIYNVELIDELIDERPERYASREVHGMDVLDLINHWSLNFSEGNILKYLLRDKGEDISDFKKIADYANREVKRLEDCK